MGKIGDFFRGLLQKIEDQNKESFGDQKLDCCDFSKDKKNDKKDYK